VEYFHPRKIDLGHLSSRKEEGERRENSIYPVRKREKEGRKKE